MNSLARAERADQMIALARAGLTLAQIGERYGLTRERIRQIVAKTGLTRDQRGVAIRSAANKRKRVASLETARMGRCMRSFGCSPQEYRAIQGEMLATNPRSPVALYRQQANNARVRNIPFRLTLPEWHQVWINSGHWEQRGRGHGKYVMSRHGDSGAYEVGNVFIQLADENNREYQRLRKQRRQQAAA